MTKRAKPKPREVTPLLYSVAETQVLLGISKSYVYRLVKRGVLRAVQLGETRRITAASIMAAAEGAEYKSMETPWSEKTR